LPSTSRAYGLEQRWANLANWGEIWVKFGNLAKVIKIWENLIRFGPNLASPKTL